MSLAWACCFLTSRHLTTLPQCILQLTRNLLASHVMQAGTDGSDLHNLNVSGQWEEVSVDVLTNYVFYSTKLLHCIKYC